VTTHKTAKDYLKMPYGRVVVPENEGGFYGEILEFPGCYSSGDTPAEAYQNLEEAAELWLEAELEDGHTIPHPFSEEEYSGKFPLRMPKDLHRQAAIMARRKGGSLNQYIVTAVAARVGADDTGERIADRIMQGIFRFSCGYSNVASTSGVASIPGAVVYHKGTIVVPTSAAPDQNILALS